MDEKSPKDEKFIKRAPATIGKYLINVDVRKGDSCMNSQTDPCVSVVSESLVIIVEFSAMRYFDEAVEVLPEERYCLLGRALARKRALCVRGATEDVNAALNLNPNDMAAHALNNEIVYLKKNFEKALILNNEFLKQRKCPDNFFLGHMKCMDAIMNSLTRERAGHPLRDHFRIIRRKAWEKNDQLGSKLPRSNNYCMKRRKTLQSTIDILARPPKTPRHSFMVRKRSSDLINSESISAVSPSTASDWSLPKMDESKILTGNLYKVTGTQKKKIPKLPSFPYKPLQNRTTNLHNFMSEKYLEKLHKDKQYLEELPLKNGFVAQNEISETKLKHLVNRGDKHLEKVQDLMRSVRPFYHIKFQELKMAPRKNTQKDLIKLQQRQEISNTFHKLINRIRLSYKARDMNKLNIFFENLVQLYERLPLTVIKDEYNNIMEAFNLIRDGYYYFGLFSLGMSREDKIKRVKLMLGIHMAKPPTTDSFFNSMKQHNPTNWKAKIAATEERLRKARFPEEIIFFNYELARFHLEMDKVEFARSYARTCIAEARQFSKMRWVINAKLLLTKISIKQNNKVDAMKNLDRMLLLSKTMNCSDLVQFVTLALKVVEDTDFNLFSNSRNIIRKRKKQILGLLQEDEKNKRRAEILFRKLSSTPSQRTMSVIPGLRVSSAIPRSQSYGQFSLASREMGSRRKSRLQKKLDHKRGSGFYDLIQDYMDIKYT